MSLNLKKLCVCFILFLCLGTAKGEEIGDKESNEHLIATETIVLDENANIETVIVENTENTEESATETIELEPPESPLYTEPFTESDLSFLEANFDGLNKNYTYNYYTAQLKLAFLTLNKKLDKTHKKYEYKKICY